MMPASGAGLTLSGQKAPIRILRSVFVGAQTDSLIILILLLDLGVVAAVRAGRG
jgi:hypothetical protein